MVKKNFLWMMIAIALGSCSSSKIARVAKSSPKKKVEKPFSKDLIESKAEAEVSEALEKGDTQRIEFLATDLFVKANDASMRGDSPFAVALFRQAVRLKPEDLFLKKKLVVELIRKGDLEESQEYLIELAEVELDEDPAMALILAGVYTAEERFEMARGVYEKVLKSHPKNEEACVFLAKNYSSEGENKKAFKLLDRCQKRSPNAPIFSYYRGKIYLSLENFKQAKKYFKRALKIDPKYYQASLAIGLMFEEKGKFSSAVKHYQKFVDSHPEVENIAILSRLVQLMFAAKKYDAVIPYSEKLVSLDPSDINLKVRLGILYSDVKRVEEAISIFKEVLVEVPTSDKVLYYLASLYQQVGDLPSSIESFMKIPEDSSLFHDSSLQVAQMLQAMAVGKDKRVFEDKLFGFIKERGKFEKTRVELALVKASYLEGESRTREAVDAMRKVKAEKGFSESHSYYLASLYDKLGERQEAVDIVEGILEKSPENAHALNFLGYSLLESGEDYDRAFQLISRAVSLSPKDGYILDSLGWYHYKVGDYQKALTALLKARQLVDGDVVISKHLALIYKKLNDVANARKFYLEALRHCRYDSEKQEVIRDLGDIESLRLPASSSSTSLVVPPSSTGN